MRSVTTILLIAASLGAADESSLSLVSPGYNHGSYEFTGTVVTTHGGSSFTTTFSGRTTATTFELNWSENLTATVPLPGTPITMSGKVSIGPNGGDVSMPGLQDQHCDDPEMAIASATGVSAGSAHDMYSLWSGKAVDILPTKDVKIVKDGAKTTVTGSLSTPFSVTVVLTNGKVTSMTSVSDPSRENTQDDKLSDADIDKVLKSLNRPMTDQERASIRKTMQDAQSTMKKDKDPTTWVTTIAITGMKD